ncbi:hypothetical protein GGI07_005273 [Coemansia sp. Benny D115]|nr:hypothetical protein GGI07_005273 [Coemansia sp. Benny D115]
MHIYKQLCNQGDPSMTLDEVHVEARLSVKPFTLSLKLCELPYSSMRTCQVRVAKGSRPPSFLPDYQLSNDPQGFTKLIVPPIADVVLVHPQSQKITQGLLSSFYATKYTAPIATARQGGTTTGRADLRNYTLVCAPLQEKQPNAATTNGNGDGNDSTIDDVVAKALWMICKRDGIAVSFSGVTLEDIMKRRVSGVFIANTTLNVLPIDTMYLTDRRRTVIEIGSCPLATHLQESIIKHLHPLEHHHIQDI